jgi:hypothetical protein
LGFLYHGVLSSSTRRVTMGSAAEPTLTIVTVRLGVVSDVVVNAMQMQRAWAALPVTQ